jgi:acid phosphatase class B
MVKTKDLSEEAQKVVDDIDKEIERALGTMKHFYHYSDSVYFVTFRYQTQEDRVKNRSQGWYFEVDLDSNTVRDVAFDKGLSKKYQITPKVK